MGSSWDPLVSLGGLAAGTPWGSLVPWGSGHWRGELGSPGAGEAGARGGLASEPGRGEGQETLAGGQATARAGATGAGMESADSPWGDMVRTATSLHTCSSCSWDNSTSTLPAVGEATSMICRAEGAQEGKGKLG